MTRNLEESDDEGDHGEGSSRAGDGVRLRRGGENWVTVPRTRLGMADGPAYAAA